MKVFEEEQVNNEQNIDEQNNEEQKEEPEEQKEEKDEEVVLTMTSQELVYLDDVRLLSINEFNNFKEKILKADEEFGFQGAWWLDSWTQLENSENAEDIENEAYKKYTTELLKDHIQNIKNKVREIKNNLKKLISKKTKGEDEYNIWVYQAIGDKIKEPEGNKSNVDEVALIRPVLVFNDFTKEDDIPDLNKVSKVDIETSDYDFTLLGENDAGKILVLCDESIGKSSVNNMEQEKNGETSFYIYKSLKRFYNEIKQQEDEESDEVEYNSGNNEEQESPKEKTSDKKASSNRETDTVITKNDNDEKKNSDNKKADTLLQGLKDVRLLSVQEFNRFKKKIAYIDSETGFSGEWWLDDWKAIKNAHNNNADDFWIYRVVNGEVESPDDYASDKNEVALIRPVVVFTKFDSKTYASELDEVGNVNLGMNKYSFTLLGKNNAGETLVLCDSAVGASAYFDEKEKQIKKENSRVFAVLESFFRKIKNSIKNNVKDSDELDKEKDDFKKSEIFKKYSLLFTRHSFWRYTLRTLDLTSEESLNQDGAYKVFNALQKIRGKFRNEGNIGLFNQGDTGFLALAKKDLLDAFPDNEIRKQIKVLIEWLADGCPQQKEDEQLFQDTFGFSIKDFLNHHKKEFVSKEKEKQQKQNQKANQSQKGQPKKKKESRQPNSKTTLFEDYSEKRFWEMLND